MEDNTIKTTISYKECIVMSLSGPPLYIIKGARFYYDESVKRYRSMDNDYLVPTFINMDDENTFKTGTIGLNIKTGDSVKFKRRSDITNRYSKVKETGRGIIKEIKPRYAIIEVNNSNGRIVRIRHSDIEKVNQYWFISSSGIIHKADVGKDKKADDFRRLTRNYFISEDEAKDNKEAYVNCLVNR